MNWKIILVIFFTFYMNLVPFAQGTNKKIKITGIVMDSNKKPVEGIQIVVDSIPSKVRTSSIGFYRLKVLPTAKKIAAFSQFYGTKEMDINGKTVINFELDGVSTETEESVKRENETINIGYGKIEKEYLSHPVSKLEGQKYGNQSYSNIYDMIRGMIPGVRVTGKSINVQGAASFYSNTEPLFVVDGIIVNQIDDIIPSQVKSIEVLKGSSASIYGSRGANGVILITLISGGDKK